MDINRNSFAKEGHWARIGWGCVVEVGGEDAAQFLQGQFSQDLRGAGIGEVRYGFWLSRTGKVEGDSWVVRRGNETFVVMSRGTAAPRLMERFEHHIIADDVYLKDVTTEWTAVWVVGAGAVDGTRAAVTPAGCWVPDPHAPQGMAAYLLVPADRAAMAALAAWPEVTERELECDRIEAGWPRVPVDLGEGDMPQEAGLEGVGVSFNKGCYLGQEVMARVQATGRVRRRLVCVEGRGAVPGGGSERLFLGEQAVGTLRSRVALPDGGWCGLAMVGAALDGLVEGELQLESGGPVVSWRIRGG